LLYRQDPRTAARIFRGEAAIIVPSDRRVNLLSSVATEIWGLCDGDGASLDQICEVLEARYDASPEVIRAETEGFLGELLALGALVRED
jgi:hypothetical protein